MGELIQDKPVTVEYLAAPGQTTFAIECKVFDRYLDAFLVEVDGTPLAYQSAPASAAEYKVVKSGDAGDVILGAGLTGGERVTITRSLPVERVSSLPEAGPVAIKAVNDELTRIVALIQDLAAAFDLMTASVGYTDEQVRDVVGQLLTAGVGVELIEDDGANSITINATGGGGGGGLTIEDVRDVIGQVITAGSNVTVTVNDAADTVTISAALAATYTDEQARDAASAMLTPGTGISLTKDDAADTVEIAQALVKTLQIPVMAAGMLTRTTAGAATGTTETTTNKLMWATLDFDASTQEHAQFMVPMPKQWDEGTVTVQFLWTAAAVGNVVWGVQAVALGDDDVLDAAFGTAQTVTDTVTATGDLMQSPFTPALTIAGTPQSEDLVCFQVYRKATDAADTVAVDAKLVGVRLKIGLAGFDDA